MKKPSDADFQTKRIGTIGRSWLPPSLRTELGDCEGAEKSARRMSTNRVVAVRPIGEFTTILIPKRQDGLQCLPRRSQHLPTGPEG